MPPKTNKKGSNMLVTDDDNSVDYKKHSDIEVSSLERNDEVSGNKDENE